MKFGILIVVASILAAAVGFQFLSRPGTRVIERDLPLVDFIPRQVEGWHGEDREIAETEVMQDAVDEILNFDEAVLRFFRQGDREFSIYIAYWSPGRMSHRLVAGHSPDVCWVNAGWRCYYMDFAQERSLRGEPLLDAQYRIFRQSNITQHVLFWHLSGGELIAYGSAGLPPLTAMFTDVLRKGLNLREEQYFIRVASNVPFEEIWNDAGFENVMEVVASIGLLQSSRAGGGDLATIQ